MRLVILFDHRFYTHPDGTIYSLKNYSPSFFRNRYLQVFSSVNIVARVADGRPRHVQWASNVKLTLLGDWRSLRAWAACRGRVTRQAVAAIRDADAVLVIAPSLIADAVYRELLQRPYSVEVVSDPYRTLGPGAIRHLARPILRLLATRSLKRLCKNAHSACYVTQAALQNVYPGGPQTLMFGCSDVDLDDDSFSLSPKKVCPSKKRYTLCNVGTMMVNYKRQDLLIRCISQLRLHGFDIEARLVGEGRFQTAFMDLAKALGITQHIHFCGAVSPGEGVRTELDRADIFVLPSMQEGLPRSLIEAMARGLPCVASNVGGVSELLPKEHMCSPGSLDSLVRAVGGMIQSPAKMNAAAQRNLQIAHQFHRSALDAPRLAFYHSIITPGGSCLSGSQQALRTSNKI